MRIQTDGRAEWRKAHLLWIQFNNTKFVPIDLATFFFANPIRQSCSNFLYFRTEVLKVQCSSSCKSEDLCAHCFESIVRLLARSFILMCVAATTYNIYHALNVILNLVHFFIFSCRFLFNTKLPSWTTFKNVNYWHAYVGPFSGRHICFWRFPALKSHKLLSWMHSNVQILNLLIWLVFQIESGNWYYWHSLISTFIALVNVIKMRISNKKKNIMSI